MTLSSIPPFVWWLLGIGLCGFIYVVVCIVHSGAVAEENARQIEEKLLPKVDKAEHKVSGPECYYRKGRKAQ